MSAHEPSRVWRILPLLALLVGCRTGEPMSEPQDGGAFAPSELAEILALEPGLRVELRYQGIDNAAGRALYPEEARAYLQRPAAEALARAHRALRTRGYGLTVWDAYRPLAITRELWETTPEELRLYVADPRRGSRHNRGCAVDVTLHHLPGQEAVEMGCEFDDFSERAHFDAPDLSPRVRTHRALLRETMEREGFRGLDDEWWHFDFKGWERYPVLDTPFREVGAPR